MTSEEFDRAMADAGITDEHWASAFRVIHALGLARLARIRLRFPHFAQRQEMA